VEIEPIDLEGFLKSRKTEKTRKYSRLLLEYLINSRDKTNREYVRSRELKENLVPEIIPNNSSFYELLHDLEKYGLIKREEKNLVARQKGKTPVFYRVNPRISQSTFDLISLSKEELIGELGRRQISIGGTIELTSDVSMSPTITTEKERDCLKRLEIAKALLKECGIDLDGEIEKRKD